VKRGSMGRGGRFRVFYGCSRYPDCDYTSPNMPIAEPCPKCGAPFIVEKKSKIGMVRACVKEGCDWEKLIDDKPASKPQSEEAPVAVKA
jgi:DNA topoisomerase-1